MSNEDQRPIHKSLETLSRSRENAWIRHYNFGTWIVNQSDNYQHLMFWLAIILNNEEFRISNAPFLYWNIMISENNKSGHKSWKWIQIQSGKMLIMNSFIYFLCSSEYSDNFNAKQWFKMVKVWLMKMRYVRSSCLKLNLSFEFSSTNI